MKQLLFYIILAFPVLAAAQSIEDNPANFGNNAAQKNKLQKCIEYEVSKDSSARENKIIHRVYNYNNDGNIVSDVTYSAQNPADSTYVLYAYNGPNLETKKYSGGINMESDMVDAATEYFEYNGQNKLTKRTLVTSAGNKTIYTYTYSTNGLPETIVADSINTCRYVFSYNDAGKVTHKKGETPIAKSSNWLEVDSYMYEYDDKNNISKETQIKEGTERKRSLFEYNTDGRLAKKTVYVYGDTKPVYTTEYTYDAKTGLPKSRTVKSLPDKNKLEYITTNYVYEYIYRK
jgi:hypothetical protein